VGWGYAGNLKCVYAELGGTPPIPAVMDGAPPVHERADDDEAEAAEVEGAEVDFEATLPAPARSVTERDLRPTTPLQDAVLDSETALSRARQSGEGRRGDNSNRQRAKAMTRDCTTDVVLFEEEVMATMRGQGKSLKITAEAKCILRVAAEAYLVGLCEDSMVVMTHCKRDTLFTDDVRVAKRLRAGAAADGELDIM